MGRRAAICKYSREQCMIAIKKVASGRKPFAEVSGLRAKKSDLKYDLQRCLEKAGQKGKVFFWIRRTPQRRWRGLYRWRYGFYSQRWTLSAFNFLEHAKPGFDRDWMSGLLFGYKPEKIQKFLDKPKT